MKYNDNGEIKDIVVKGLDQMPVGSIIDYDGTDVPDGWEQVEDIEDFSSKVTLAETPLNATFIKQGNMITIQFIGALKQHSAGTNILTIPDGYRVGNQHHFPAVRGLNAGNIVLNTDGKVNVNAFSGSTTENARVCFNITYFIGR